MRLSRPDILEGKGRQLAYQVHSEKGSNQKKKKKKKKKGKEFAPISKKFFSFREGSFFKEEKGIRYSVLP